MESLVLTFCNYDDIYVAQQLLKNAGIKTKTMTAAEAVGHLEAEYLLSDITVKYHDGSDVPEDEFDELIGEIGETMAYVDGFIDQEAVREVMNDILKSNNMEVV